MNTSLLNGIPCSHPGCLQHTSHPCEGCGRIAGRKKQIFLDYTMMSCFHYCRRKYFLRHIMNLVPLRDSAALEYGVLFHSVLSKWYSTHDLREAMIPIGEWEDYEYDEMRTQVRALEIFANYFTTYPKEPWEILANEVPIEEKIGEDEEFEYFLIGKIDLVIRWYNMIYGVDHKTTSQLGDKYFDKFKPDLQMSGYSWALYQLPGFRDKVQGMLINAINTAKTAGLLGSKVKPFGRHISTRTKQELESYPEMAMPLMRDIALAERDIEPYKILPNYDKQRDKYFYRNQDNCTSKYGPCQYREACLKNLSPEHLAANFKVSIWDPRDVEE